MSRTLRAFGDFNFDILLAVLDVVIFCVPFFVGGLPHKKGCLYTRYFYRINHFNSKWGVQYLALFVVCAASLRPSSLQTKFSRIFFSASWEFPPRAFLSRTLHDFWWFQLWYFAHCAWCFSFFVFYYFLGGYVIERVFANEILFIVLIKAIRKIWGFVLFVFYFQVFSWGQWVKVQILRLLLFFVCLFFLNFFGLGQLKT